MSGHDVVRTKYIHQVTASTLHQLQNQAYKDSGTDLMFGEWCSEMKDKSPTFHFWALVLKMELILLEFLRSIHSVDFQLYVTAMEKMMLCFFALCHTHYIWWLSMHVFDIKMLPANNPDIYQAFQVLCCFIVSRTRNSLSSMGLDQRHEHKDVKGDGGILGLTENEEKMRRWMVSGPEATQTNSEFEAAYVLKKEGKKEFCHHEETPSFQKRFVRSVSSLISEFEKLGNPFSDYDGDELLQICSRDVMSATTIETI